MEIIAIIAIVVIALVIAKVVTEIQIKADNRRFARNNPAAAKYIARREGK